MTRFRPACESLDARTLPSAVMPAPETSFVAEVRAADPAPEAAKPPRGGYDLLVGTNKLTDEPAATADNLWLGTPLSIENGGTSSDGSDWSGEALSITNGGTEATAYDNLWLGEPLSIEIGGTRAVPYNHAVGGGTWGTAADDGTAYDHNKGGGNWVVAPDDGMLLPAVHKVRQAAARM